MANASAGACYICQDRCSASFSFSLSNERILGFLIPGSGALILLNSGEAPRHLTLLNPNLVQAIPPTLPMDVEDATVDLDKDSIDAIPSPSRASKMMAALVPQATGSQPESKSVDVLPQAEVIDLGAVNVSALMQPFLLALHQGESLRF